MAKYLVRPATGRIPWGVKSMPNRGDVIAGAMIHATRSGASGLYDDGPGTENWGMSPNNGSAAKGWGSFWDRLVFRTGTRVVCTDVDHEYASWTAGYGGSGTWAAGVYYIQYEVSQSRIDQPFSEESIDSLAEAIAEDSIKYDFPLERIPYLSQVGPRPRGIATHEGSANGRKLGKTDPGPLFPWGEFLEKARHYAGQGDDELSAEDKAKLERLERELTTLKSQQEALVGVTVGNGKGDIAQQVAELKRLDGRGVDLNLYLYIQQLNDVVHGLADAVDTLADEVGGDTADTESVIAAIRERLKPPGDKAA